MPSFWEHVKRVLREADIIIEVLDARLIEESRNKEIEDKIARLVKQLLFVFNKCDLADTATLEKAKKEYHPSVFISSTKKLGTTILLQKILELSKGQPVVVGIVGYPNVGKSSLINALAGRNAARTSGESGFTKGFQKVRISRKIVLLDTPGVFPYQKKSGLDVVKIGAVDYAKVEDPEIAALELIQEYDFLIKGYYRVEGETADDILEQIAFKLNRLHQGGKPDYDSAARQVLKDWQKGKIRA